MGAGKGAGRGEPRPKVAESPLPSVLRPGQRPPPPPRHLQASARPSRPKAASSRRPVLVPAPAPVIHIPQPIAFSLLPRYARTLLQLPSLTAVHRLLLSPRLNCLPSLPFASSSPPLPQLPPRCSTRLLPPPPRRALSSWRRRARLRLAANRRRAASRQRPLIGQRGSLSAYWPRWSRPVAQGSL